jgi:hypothetical protein
MGGVFAVVLVHIFYIVLPNFKPPVLLTVFVNLPVLGSPF